MMSKHTNNVVKNEAERGRRAGWTNNGWNLQKSIKTCSAEMSVYASLWYICYVAQYIFYDTPDRTFRWFTIPSKWGTLLLFCTITHIAIILYIVIHVMRCSIRTHIAARMHVRQPVRFSTLHVANWCYYLTFINFVFTPPLPLLFDYCLTLYICYVFI